MKILGLIGGLSGHSSVKYYDTLIRDLPNRSCPYNTGPIILYSVNTKEIYDALKNQDWQTIDKIIINAAVSLEKAGAQLLAICCNTLHKTIPSLERTIQIPLIHILEQVALHIKSKKYHTIGVLGTKQTLSDHFYLEKLSETGVKILLPTRDEIQELDRVIMDELVQGNFHCSSKFLEHLCLRLKRQGAEAIVLGCTELPLALQNSSVEVNLIDTLALHAEKIIDAMLN